MYFQIKEIILWPKKPNTMPRRLPFKLGRVNVITGASKTGKSAIIPIIDYCLGSDKCTIPVRTIRDACAWFGIVVSTAAGEKLFARKEPGSQKATGEMFVIEGSNLDIPKYISEKNTTVEAVKHSLDELAGLTALDFNIDQIDTGFKARPSFRDLGAFMFQPQSIVADPNILFYKAGYTEHREKLRTIFPYILNAITPALLAKQHELIRLRKELRRKENELNNLEKISNKWISEVKARVSEARELGLIKEPIRRDASKDLLLEKLRDIVKIRNINAQVTNESISESIRELLQLQEEETNISLEISSLRKRFAEMSKLKSSTQEYLGALQVQRDRLKVSKLLSKRTDSNNRCPICGNTMNTVAEQLKMLTNSLERIERTAGDFSSIPAAFDREFNAVKDELGRAMDKLNGVRLRIQALEKSSKEVEQQRYDSLRISRFVGGIEHALQVYESIGTDGTLSQECQLLRTNVDKLEKDVNEARVRAKTRKALNNISLLAGRLLPDLDIERPDDPISLSIDDLTITIQDMSRTDYLWEIGSGANWLSYHLAVTLALQQYFLSLPQNPVPGLLIYDQPSQVYFPKEFEIDRDEDVSAVAKIFDVISRVVKGSSGKLQVIVLDHAPEKIWGKINYVDMVEEWRGGNKLVPSDWLK